MTSRTEILPGVFLHCIQSDKFKTGGFSVNLIRPLCREDAARNALIPSVLLRGTAIHPDIRRISMALDNLYGSSVGTIIRKKGGLQVIGLYADYIEDALVGEPIFEKTADFVRELLFEPLLTDNGFMPEAVYGEKQNLINAIRARFNNKRSYAMTEMLKIMFQNEPYGISRIGEEEDLAEVTPQGLYTHYQNLLATSRVELFYMGSKAPQTVREVFERMLSKLPRHTIYKASNVISKEPVEAKYAAKTLPIAQSQLCIGYRTESLHTVKALADNLVFSILYGSGSNSKLFLNVREKKSLCYSIGSSMDRYQDLMVVYTGISADRKDTAMEEIEVQLRACMEGDFSDEDLETAKKQVESNQRAGMDNPNQLDDFYVGEAALERNITMQEILLAARTVTKQDVMRAAAAVRRDTVYFLEGDAT